MDNVLKLEDLPDTSPGVMDKLPIDVLIHLQEEAERHAASAAQMLGVLHETFARRYAAGINDTGTTHRVDNGIDIGLSSFQLDNGSGVIQNPNLNFGVIHIMNVCIDLVSHCKS